MILFTAKNTEMSYVVIFISVFKLVELNLFCKLPILKMAGNFVDIALILTNDYEYLLICCYYDCIKHYFVLQKYRVTAVFLVTCYSRLFCNRVVSFIIWLGQILCLLKLYFIANDKLLLCIIYLLSVVYKLNMI